MLKISKENLEIIKLITDPTKEHYVDLPRFLARFHYPVSLELSEYIGKTAYQRGFADALEFLCLMANKFYTGHYVCHGTVKTPLQQNQNLDKL